MKARHPTRCAECELSGTHVLGADDKTEHIHIAPRYRCEYTTAMERKKAPE
jgi:hypothetical protein